MEITLDNRIEIGDEQERLHEVFEAEFASREGKNFISFINMDHEKVIFKFDEMTFAIIRYIKPTMVMRFDATTPTFFEHSTLGLLEIQTQFYRFRPDNIILDYTLSRNSERISRYHLEIDYAKG